jgi:hypothetical protein
MAVGMRPRDTIAPIVFSRYSEVTDRTQKDTSYHALSIQSTRKSPDCNISMAGGEPHPLHSTADVITVRNFQISYDNPVTTVQCSSLIHLKDEKIIRRELYIL